MASERAKQMQQANMLSEVLASLERIEIALGLKPKPAEVKEPLPDEVKEPVEVTPEPQAQMQGQRSGVTSRQNPARGQR